MADAIKPIRRNDLLVREVENENIIYDHTNNAVHSLNITAKFIWDCCDGSRSIPEIAKDVTLKFNVDADTALKDVEKTVKEFKEKHLLQEHRSGKTV